MTKQISNRPVQVNANVWFYELPKTIEFVAYNGQAQAKPAVFKISKAKLKKYLQVN